MNEKFLSPYNPSNTEDRLYAMWEESGFFNPDEMIAANLTKPDAETFSIVLPPPNVTGTLHTGHASMLAIEDIMVRYQRMLGKRTLWLPGTDHAAIATQSKVEKILQKEKIRKQDLGREAFLERVHAFAQESHDTIISQSKKMGASLDWSREAYTLDKPREEAVYTAFKRMYDDGLIYKKERIVNWDPKGQTTISDDEVIRVERPAKMYTFKYSADFPFPIATTRPETKLGDTAVAVHPDDKRYQEYIGKEYSFNFAGEDVTVKIVADEHVDPEFGVGALGVTPAHSQADWEIAERHNLPLKQVINEYGKMMVGMEGVIDQKVEAAREAVVQWLREQNLLENEEDIMQSVGTAERTGAVIEPLPKLQWWISVDKKITLPQSNIEGIKAGDEVSLKELMLQVVRNSQIDILPERFEKTYFHWIENLRDWNISRQIWFGHRIPVWYGKDGSIHLPEEKTIYFARHGESEGNKKQVFSKPDAALTDQGKEQARESAVGINKAGKKIEYIFTSPFPRAIETAEIIAKEIGYTGEIKILDEIQEVDVGNLEGTPLPDVAKRMDYIYREETHGDTPQSVVARVKDVISKIEKEIPNNSLLVGHTGFWGSLFSVIDGKESDEDMKNIKSYRFKNGEIRKKVFLKKPHDENLTQDEDTLDTWFSSGLWTFSTLGWPNTDAEDFKTYHPTNVLETGHDIIFFWVARMILMTTYLLGDIPFKTVYMHGLVRDAKGRKMSKSLGNIVDPVELIEKYGTDALRMALIVGNGPGNDVNLDENKIKAYSKFANKLWNITRFVLTETDGFVLDSTITYSKRDQELINEQNVLIEEITKEMNDFKYYLVSEKIYHYTWHTFADQILEESKEIFQNGDDQAIASRKQFLRHTLKWMLKTLHPFMPFITEEIWQEIKDDTDRDILMTELWPTS